MHEFMISIGINRRRAWVAVLGAVLGAVCVLGLIAPGCGTPSGETDETAAGITRNYERGPVQLTLHAPADQITTAEILELTLTATSDSGYTVSFPPFPEPPAEDAATEEDAAATAGGSPSFVARNIEDAPPSLGDDGRVTRRRTYYLEPFLDGQYTVPPLPVSFWEEVEGEDDKSVLETEPVDIAVVSVIGPNEDAAVRAIAGPVAVREPAPWGLYLLLVMLVAAAVGAGYWYKFVRVPPAAPLPPPVPPHQRALAALEAIRQSGLVERGQYKEYYTRVSDVLRHYMEDQFHLRAPERTTEEFLDEIQHNGVLGLHEQLLLREFLRHCDLVKFARVEPTAEQVQDTFSTCERFIIDSEAAHRASQVPVQPASTGGA